MAEKVLATSDRSEEALLTDVSPNLDAGVHGATGVDGKREKSWGGTDLQPPVQGDGIEVKNEGGSDSSAVTYGAAPKKKKKKSKSKAQRGLVDLTDIPACLISLTHRYFRASLLVLKNTTSTFR